MDFLSRSDHNGRAVVPPVVSSSTRLDFDRPFPGATRAMAILLAAVKQTKNELSLIPVIALVVALVIALVMAYRVYGDLKQGGEETLTEPDDLLQPIINAYSAGQMSREEYQRACEAVGRAGIAGDAPVSKLPRAESEGPQAPASPPPAPEG